MDQIVSNNQLGNEKLAAEQVNKPVTAPESCDDIAALLKANLEMTKDIRAMVKHINNYVAWQRMFGWLKFLLILIPLIIGVMYLPPLLQDYYQQMLGTVTGNLVP